MPSHVIKLAEFVFPKAESPGDKHILKQIKRRGWSVLAIPGDPDEGPPFAFTIGLYLHALAPEILVMGMDAATAGYVLNKVGAYIMAGKKLSLDQRYSDIVEEGDLLFRQIDFRHYQKHLGTAIWFYARQPQAFPALQCFWADKNGHFPHEPNCRERVIELQPDLST